MMHRIGMVAGVVLTFCSIAAAQDSGALQRAPASRPAVASSARHFSAADLAAGTTRTLL
jgi:hypothetical protein